MLPVSVGVAAADINLTTDTSVMHLTGSETVTGAKNFTGGISKSGVAVATTSDVSSAISSALAGTSPAQAPVDAQGTGLTHSGIGQTVGGVVLTAGMRVLDTATGVTSGLWVTASGVWTRPTDFATGSNAQGKLVEVDNGGIWLCVSASAVTVGTTSQVWAQIDVSAMQAGTGLSKSGNTLNLAMTKTLVTATGLSYSDVGADAAGAAATVQTNLNTEASSRASADTTLQTQITTNAAKVNGVTVSGTPAAGQTLVASSSAAAAWANLTITGQYLGAASTFSGLPTTDPAGQAASNGDWAALNTDVVGSGTTNSPQYPRGIYIYNGSAFSLGLSTDAADTAAIVQGNLNTEASTRAAADTANATAISAEAVTARAAEATLAKRFTTVYKSASYNANVGELVVCDPTSASFPVNLPSGALSGDEVAIRRKSVGGTNSVSATRSGSDTINGAATALILSLDAETAIFTSNGAGDWTLSSGHKSLSSTHQLYGFAVSVKDPRHGGAKGDGRYATASISASSANVTLSGTTASAGDVGKKVIFYGAGSSGANLITTIQSYTDSTHVVLANAASTAVSSGTMLWGTDDTAAIQAAIDYAIYTAGATKHIFFPYAIYLTSDVLHFGYGYTFTTFIAEGEASYRVDSSTNLQAAIVPTFNDRPCINVQGTRNSRIKNLSLVGQNYAWLYANYNSITDRSVLANWMGPSISSANNTQYAPYAGIAVDAYAGSQPTTHYPTVTYPSFTGISSQYNKNYSSGLTLENVHAWGFCAGLVNQPGQVPDGSNGDFITRIDCDFGWNLVGYADGHADARNVNGTNSRMHFCYSAFDSLTYGNQHGTLEITESGSSFDNCYRILNISIAGYTIQGGYPARFTGCYGEALYSLGTAYVSGTSNTSGVTFQGAKFTFIYKNSEYSPVYLYNGPGTDLHLQDINLDGAFGFHNFNCNLIADSITLDKLQADGSNSGAGTAYKVAKSYTCRIWAQSAPHMRIRPAGFYTFFGYSKTPLVMDSEAFPIDLDASASAGTNSGFAIPWFINQLSYGKSKSFVSEVAPLTFDRATYNLSPVSQSTLQYTFTVSQSFISDALGAGALSSSYQTYSIGKGDIIVDNATGVTFFVVSVSFSGTTSATIVMQQLTQIRTPDNGTTWYANGSLGTSTGTMTIYNARRAYPSYKRVSFTATSASGAIAMKQNGSEDTVAYAFYVAGVGDYLISSSLSQGVADSVFPQTKIAAVNTGNGSVTVDQNARRAYFGEAPLFVKGTL